MRGTHELRFAGTPAHEFRRRQLLQRLRHDTGEVLLDGLSALDGTERVELALGVLAACQRTDLHAAAPREAQQGLRWRAVVALRLRHVRTLAFDLALRLYRQHARDQRGE